MPKSQIDGTTLLAAVVAAGVGFLLLNSPYFWMASIAGLSLAIVLLAFDRDGYRSVFESIGFAAAAALGLALAAAVPLAWLRPRAADAPVALPIAGDWLPIVWAGFTLLVTVIDRARMGGRVQYAPAAVPQPVVSLRTPAPAPPVYQPAPEPVRATPAPEPPAAPAVTPRPTFTRPSFSEAPSEPIVATPEPIVERAPEPVAPPPPPPPPAAAPVPQAIAIPPGKEAMIYVTLMGEGLNVLRAVRAEHLGRDFYKIADEMPETETWQFVPGQVVKCQKKNLSSGKALVAIEEAPRAR